MKKYETVIFDLDGTLLYTLEDLTKATNYALRRMNMPERTLDDVRRFVGNGVARLIELAVPEGTAPEVFERRLRFSGSIMIFTAMTIQKPMTE